MTAILFLVSHESLPTGQPPSLHGNNSGRKVTDQTNGRQRYDGNIQVAGTDRGDSPH